MSLENVTDQIERLEDQVALREEHRRTAFLLSDSEGRYLQRQSGLNLLKCVYKSGAISENITLIRELLDLIKSVDSPFCLYSWAHVTLLSFKGLVNLYRLKKLR